MENYICNVVLSFGLIEILKEVTQIKLIENLIDFIIMLLMVLVSRLVTYYVEKKIKNIKDDRNN